MSSAVTDDAVFVAEEIFEQDAEGVGEAGEVGSGGFGEGVEAEDVDFVLAADEGGGAAEGIGILVGHCGLQFSLSVRGPGRTPGAKLGPGTRKARGGGKEKRIKNRRWA